MTVPNRSNRDWYEWDAFFIVETGVIETPWPQLAQIWLTCSKNFCSCILIPHAWDCDGIKKITMFLPSQSYHCKLISVWSVWRSHISLILLGTLYIIQVVHVWNREAKPFICQGLNFDRTHRKCSTLRFHKDHQRKRILTTLSLES